MDSVLKCARLQLSGPTLIFSTTKKKNKVKIKWGASCLNTHLKESSKYLWLQEPAQNRVQVLALFRLCCCYGMFIRAKVAFKPMERYTHVRA
jgi:hypothetical protein